MQAGQEARLAIRGLAQGLRLEPGVDVQATLRTLQWTDAFPAVDHDVLTALCVPGPAQARAATERWRPWRAYAVMCLWQSLESANAAQQLDSRSTLKG